MSESCSLSHKCSYLYKKLKLLRDEERQWKREIDCCPVVRTAALHWSLESLLRNHHRAAIDLSLSVGMNQKIKIIFHS